LLLNSSVGLDMKFQSLEKTARKVPTFGKRALVLLAVAVLASCGKREARMAPAAAIESGWNEYRLGEFDRAIARFEAARAATDPGSEEHLQALYGLAATWSLRLPVQDQDRALGEQLYRQILETNPQSPLAPWADLALARLKHLVPVGEDADYAILRPAYQAIMDKYPGHLAAREAFIYLMSTKVATLESNQLREAITQLRQFVSQTNDRTFFSPAYSLLAVSHTALGEQQERLDVEITSLDATEVDPENPYNEFAWQYWNIATIAEFELGNFEIARKYYRMLLDEYPRDRRVYGAKQALKRMDEVEAHIKAGGS
jgi:tetratricopeptide (TPR) repeat protein